MGKDHLRTSAGSACAAATARAGCALELIAFFLLDMAERCRIAANQVVEIPVTLDFIADYLSPGSKTVSHTLTDPRHRGFLRPPGRRSGAECGQGETAGTSREQPLSVRRTYCQVCSAPASDTLTRLGRLGMVHVLSCASRSLWLSQRSGSRVRCYERLPDICFGSPSRHGHGSWQRRAGATAVPGVANPWAGVGVGLHYGMAAVPVRAHLAFSMVMQRDNSACDLQNGIGQVF